MIVFPETMKKLDSENVQQSVGTLESYIRYMCDRIDFSMRNVTKAVSAAGVSNAEIYVLVSAMDVKISTLSSQLTALGTEVNSLKGRIERLEAAVFPETQEEEGEESNGNV